MTTKYHPGNIIVIDITHDITFFLGTTDWILAHPVKYHFNTLTFFILIDFPIHIDTISWVVHFVF